MNNTLRKLKFPVLFLMLLVGFSSMYGRTKSPPKTPRTTPKNTAKFEISNRTKIGVTLEIRQHVLNDTTPLKERTYESFYFKPKETKTFSIPIKINPSEPKIARLSAHTRPKKEFRESGCTFKIDITQLEHNVIEGYLHEDLHRPGDELWPPVESWPIISLKILKPKSARIEKKPKKTRSPKS